MNVHITLRGRPYRLRTDQHEDLRAIAAFVDEKLGEVVERHPRLDEYSAALLAALNIASEFERYRRAVHEELQEIERELATSALLVEALLPAASR